MNSHILGGFRATEDTPEKPEQRPPQGEYQGR